MIHAQQDHDHALEEQLEIFASLKKGHSPQKEIARSKIKLLLAAAVFEGDMELLGLITPVWAKLTLPNSFADMLAVSCINPAQKNGPEIFAMLIDCGAVSNLSHYLHRAITDQNPSLVKILAGYLDQGLCSDALRAAAVVGNADVIKVLLPHANPKAKNSSPLLNAAIYGNKDAIDILYPLSEPSVALRDLEKQPQPAHHEEGIQHLKNLIKKDKALKQRAKILSKVMECATPTPPKRLKM